MSSDRVLVRNAALNVGSEGLWGLGAGLVASSTVLTVLLRSLGAGEGAVALIPALEGGLWLVLQAVGLFIFTSLRDRKRLLVNWLLLGYAPFLFLNGLLILLLPRLGPAVVRVGLLASFTAGNMVLGITIAAWIDWLAHLFPIRIRGTVWGISMFAASSLSAGGSLAAGYLLRRWPDPLAFGALYAASGAAVFLSLLGFRLIHDPAESEPPSASPAPRLRDLAARFRDSLGHANFRAFLFGRLLSVAGFSISPLLAVHYQSARGGGLPAASVVANGAAITAGNALGYILLGRLGDRRGHRLGILAGAAAQVAALAALLALPGEWGCRLTYFLVGICGSAGYISHTNLILETCPHDHRVAHITLANVAMGLPMLLLPALAGALAERWGLQPVFLVSLAFSVAAALWYLLRVKDPRSDGNGAPAEEQR